MDMKELKTAAGQIRMPAEMQNRIMRKCKNSAEENNMTNTKTSKVFKKPLAATATIALCLCLTGVTAFAATGKLQGFFKDIFRIDGAVVGTSYEQATDEVNITAEIVSDSLFISLEFVAPDTMPYKELDTLAIGKYEIINAAGAITEKGGETDYSDIIDGKSKISIPADNIGQGNYTIVIKELIGSKKADQPLSITGTWEVNFTKQ